MRVIRKNVYKFSELSEEIQDKIIEKYYENEQYEYLQDFLYDEFAEIDKDNYFNNAKLFYSLCYFKGDGLSISADFDFEKWINKKTKFSERDKKRLIECIYKVDTKRNVNGHNYTYSSFNDVGYDLNYEINEDLYEKLLKVINDIANYYLFVCKKLEKYGYETIEYRMSRKEFNEMADNNKYEYYIDGNQY